MALQLPEAINHYFAASNGSRTHRIPDFFEHNAVVIDEGATHRGHAAIQSWLQETQSKFEYRVEPISSSEENKQITVIANVIGNFPNSPIKLHHVFQLNDSKIQSLEIS